MNGEESLMRTRALLEQQFDSEEERHTVASSTRIDLRN